MDIHHRSPEDYFDELLYAIAKANRYFRDFDRNALENARANNADQADKFIDLYALHFHDALKQLLIKLGALEDSLYFIYNYNETEYNLLELEQVLNHLRANRDLFIARIKEETTFVPQPSSKNWVDSFKNIKSLSDNLQEEFESIGIENKRTQ